MKFISWNVNGFRAVLKKGFEDYFYQADADFFCLQETKMQEGQADFAPEGYLAYYHSADRKGYSGTAVFTKHEPQAIFFGIRLHGLDGEPEHADEGRVMTLEYPDFYLVNCYVPNAQPELRRLDYRMAFENDMRAYLLLLNEKKPVIYCGDLNVAHKEIDIKNPASNRKNAGFTDEERAKMTELLNQGFIDSFRHFFPDKKDAYSWWSYFSNARERNVGWRIDYFLVSDRLKESLTDAAILSEIMGSDHCPVILELEA
ncbi:MAG TPA: exodeoxyribonuclease III [Firmicutes bacterium]|nr:exodeoxyribonuclease III [Bacillota bacterium]